MPPTPTFQTANDPVAIEQLIAALSSFHPLSEGLKNQIATRVQTVKLEKDEFLMKQGEHCYYFYFLVNGILVATTNRNHKELTTFIVTDGNFVTSVTGMYGYVPSEDTVHAVEDALLLALHADDMQEMYDRFPESNIILRKIFENYFQGAHERSNMTRLNTAKEKYLYLQSYMPDHIHRIPLAHKASYLDIRPETLIRIKKELQSEQDESQWADTCSKLNAHIDEHLSFRQKNLTLAQLAKESNIPIAQLNFLLKNNYNKSFTKYVNSLRVNYVKEKLAKEDEWKHLTIEAVGIDAGFKSRSVFFSEFKKQTGITPGEFVRTAGKSPEFEFETT
ncbi:helix-turn-helix domain-containing protein [Pedobacter sp.]|jgi:AraC-like DNA-binding protein|uniref:helix-turn-helix domain-containing protein n=1 Tax=Pedobacter sp. TaxID=1411316 RepID=UPI002BD1284C|nr:helix-turn-helix domain-containing protein [Pedobacter sp.]HWW42349.1 helix-turn-helix domain-containing protein [Pedobacter sp.]